MALPTKPGPVFTTTLHSSSEELADQPLPRI